MTLTRPFPKLERVLLQATIADPRMPVSYFLRRDRDCRPADAAPGMAHVVRPTCVYEPQHNAFVFRGPTMSLFEILPQTDLAINIFFWVFLACAVMLTVRIHDPIQRRSCLPVPGFDPNAQRIHLEQRRYADACLRFLPDVRAVRRRFIPVDRWLRVRRGREDAAVPLCSPWAQRMLQIQTAVVYFATFYWKSLGILWINGTAVYYALRLEDFQRFPLPPLHNLFLIKTLTWSTLVIEFALGVLIWFKETRYPVLLARHMSAHWNRICHEHSSLRMDGRRNLREFCRT